MERALATYLAFEAAYTVVISSALMTGGGFYLLGGTQRDMELGASVLVARPDQVGSVLCRAWSNLEALVDASPSEHDDRSRGAEPCGLSGEVVELDEEPSPQRRVVTPPVLLGPVVERDADPNTLLVVLGWPRQSPAKIVCPGWSDLALPTRVTVTEARLEVNLPRPTRTTYDVRRVGPTVRPIKAD